ncbi:hypothetical protein [Burkholderia sp. Ac-20344]|uniref:hypothetical protein n=1 Tax=Burkholderia sp. Ac-20344 TaxID=2703890 RepID=UPI00197BECE1|nr:hypothetical protein [Burkholderia sp. Ac-20344]MBN3832924.1 hypothetical protein [Burkholderia sp. Ac-20344]
MSDKALKACADYARINAEIKRLTSAIAGALHYCKGVRGTCGIGEDGTVYGDHNDVTHLKHAFTHDVDDVGNAVFMTDAEIREYLYENCDCCLKAYGFVLERKAAKKAFGAVKRSIGAIGRTELAREA